MKVIKFAMPSLVKSSLFDDELFNNSVFGDFEYFRSKNVPKTNVIETDASFDVQLAIPGVKKSDLKIVVDKRVLTVSKEEKEEHEKKNDKYSLKEFSFTSFSKSFTLPDNVDTEGIKSKCEDGVLKITIPKTEEKNKKIIDIE
jgi:HSP20 family protein